MGAAIAQWIRLHFNPAAPGSNPKHTRFNLNCHMLKRRHKQKKRQGLAIFKNVAQSIKT